MVEFHTSNNCKDFPYCANLRPNLGVLLAPLDNRKTHSPIQAYSMATDNIRGGPSGASTRSDTTDYCDGAEESGSLEVHSILEERV